MVEKSPSKEIGLFDYKGIANKRASVIGGDIQVQGLRSLSLLL